jgi:hypothetical protein
MVEPASVLLMHHRKYHRLVHYEVQVVEVQQVQLLGHV